MLPAFGSCVQCSLGWAIWAHPQFFLTEAVDLWAVSDTITEADAVAVFGGGVTIRPFAAAEYYRERLVPKVLVSNISPNVADREIVYSETDSNRRVLVGHGVPAAAIELFWCRFDEHLRRNNRLATMGRLHQAPLHHRPHGIFLVAPGPVDIRHEFAGTGIEIEVPALDDPQYPRKVWWTDDKAILNFQNEIIKYVYYRIRY